MSNINSILSPHVYEPISRYLAEHGGNYMEIGVFNGIGFAKIARDHPNVRCEAIDPFIEDGHTSALSTKSTGQHITDQEQSALAAIKDLGNAHINIVTSQEYFANLTDELVQDLKISVVLIDGDHHYEHVVNDYKLAMALIGNKSGIIVFDDMRVADVSQAYQNFKEDYSDRLDREQEIGVNSPGDFSAMAAYIKEQQ